MSRPISKPGRYPQINFAIALFSIFLIGAIWVATTQRIHFERAEAIDGAIKVNSNLVMALEEQTVRTFKAAEQVALFVRHEYAMLGSSLNMAGYIEHGVIKEKIFTIISVVNEHGDIVLSTMGTGPVNYADREFFTFHRQHPNNELFISKPVLGRISGTRQIPMSIRIDKADGTFGGVVVLSVDPGYFTGFYQQADLGRRGVVALVGLDGIVRARRVGPVNSYGENIGESPAFAGRTPNPLGSYIATDRDDGVRRIYSYRTLQHYPLLLVLVGTAETEVLARFRQRERNYYVAAVLASALIVAFAFFLIAALSRQRRAVEALSSSEAQFRATFNQAAMGIAHIAPDGRFLRANQKLCNLLGYSERELLTRTLLGITDPADVDEAGRFQGQLLVDDTRSFTPEIEMRYVRKDGSTIWVCVAAGLVRNPSGQPDYFVTVTQDISKRKELQERLAHQAHHDSLTQLANRALCYDRLEQALVQAQRRKQEVGFLFIDLDGFKDVNDSLGHGCGDQLLQQVAARLTRCVRSEDTVGRLGGDEFAIVLSEIAKKADCELVARKIVDALAEPFRLDKHEVRVSASIGIATYPDDGDHVGMLVRHADMAMFCAKKAGKNYYRFYSADMSRASVD